MNNEFDKLFDVNHDGKLDFCEDAMRHKVAMDIMDGTLEKKFENTGSVRSGGYSYRSGPSKPYSRSGSIPVVKKEVAIRREIIVDVVFVIIFWGNVILDLTSGLSFSDFVCLGYGVFFMVLAKAGLKERKEILAQERNSAEKKESEKQKIYG